MDFKGNSSLDQKKVRHFIPGFHSVKETLQKGQTDVDELWVSEKKDSARVREILRIAEMKGIPVLFKKARALDNLFPGIAHQGIAVVSREFIYADLEDLIHGTRKGVGRALLIAADHITDEGNLGALIRTAVFFGVQGLILPKDRSAKMTQKVMKRSSGAYAHLCVARIVNMGRTLDRLKERGFWVIGTAGEGRESIYRFDWDRDLVLVLGSEEKGLSRTVRSRCHEIVHIPAEGGMGALNVSVACGVTLSEIVRQRNATAQRQP